MLAITLPTPLILTVLLGATVSRLSGALRPSVAVRLLSLGGALVAMGTGMSLSVVAMFLLARADRVAALGHWSQRALPNPGDLPWLAGVPVAAAVALLLLAAAVHAVRAGHRLWVADGLCRRLGPTLDDHRTVVIEQDEPDAYAVAGIHGRIVISTAMLAALTEPERRVLLAHEQAHLAHRHHLWIQLSEIAAAAAVRRHSRDRHGARLHRCVRRRRAHGPQHRATVRLRPTDPHHDRAGTCAVTASNAYHPTATYDPLDY